MGLLLRIGLLLIKNVLKPLVDDEAVDEGFHNINNFKQRNGRYNETSFLPQRYWFIS